MVIKLESFLSCLFPEQNNEQSSVSVKRLPTRQHAFLRVSQVEESLSSSAYEIYQRLVDCSLSPGLTAYVE